MRIFESKKMLRNTISLLENRLRHESEKVKEVVKYNEELADSYEEMLKNFPLNLGDRLYVIELKSANGRYTKTKPCKEFSSIIEMIVDTKNYFKLVERFRNREAFFLEIEAEDMLNELCGNESTEA